MIVSEGTAAENLTRNGAKAPPFLPPTLGGNDEHPPRQAQLSPRGRLGEQLKEE